MHRLFVQVEGETERAVEVDGHCTLSANGGDVRVPALGGGTLAVTPAVGGFALEATVPLRIGARAVAPGTRRVLLEGERAAADGFALRVGPESPPEGTRALAAALAAGFRCEPETGPWVLVMEGPDAGVHVTLAAPRVAGRGAGCGLRLSDPGVSRRHVRLEPRPGGGVVVHDLGSKNGVIIAGRRVRRRATAVAGDEVQLGSTVLLVRDGAPVRGGDPGEPAANRVPSGVGGEVPGGDESARHESRRSRRVTLAAAFASAALLAAACLLAHAAG